MLVLRPGDRQGEPRGEHEVVVRGEHVLSFRFGVTCAWKLRAMELLELGDPGLLPLLPFTEGASEDRIDEAFRVLSAVPGQRGVELQVALATFSGQVFPARRWLAKIGKESLMESTVWQEIIAEGEVQGRRKLLAYQLRVRLGKSKRTEALVSRLAHCTDSSLEKIGGLLVGSKKKTELREAIERIAPAAPEPS